MAAGRAAHHNEGVATASSAAHALRGVCVQHCSCSLLCVLAWRRTGDQVAHHGGRHEEGSSNRCWLEVGNTQGVCSDQWSSIQTTRFHGGKESGSFGGHFSQELAMECQIKR